MSKEEILEKYHTHQAMDVYAKEVAIGFAEWINEDGWREYDGSDRWIRIEGRQVLETKQLYQQYLNQRS